MQQLNCTLIETFTLEDSHPNNVDPALKNQTYLSGGNRYRIATVLTERRGRPTGVVADIYVCSSAHQVKPTVM
ncbi:hypothetical protein JCM19237_1796 [Photobacterium aphoticum]|uniref:Uncharacterized protein n=1 Tax=Photobacterium aphoticum TaxID=754436 RepID=A0A090QTB4_9GAMM|nr:hypothetical protein JCM19237_1796 [Photobacterium aphoticum]